MVFTDDKCYRLAMKLRVTKLAKSLTVSQIRRLDQEDDEGEPPQTVALGTLVTYRPPHADGRPKFEPMGKDFESTVRAGRCLAILHEENGHQALWASSPVTRMSPTRTGWVVRTQNSTYLVESMVELTSTRRAEVSRGHVRETRITAPIAPLAFPPSGPVSLQPPVRADGGSPVGGSAGDGGSGTGNAGDP